MSSIWKKPWYTPKQQEQNWLNNIWQYHDNICSCQNTWLHLIQLINKESNHRKPLKDLSNILCLITGKENGLQNTEDDDPGFLPGELDRLFEENGEKESTENVDTR